MWALCERGDLSNFIYTSKVHGTAELEKHPDLTLTGSMVLQLAEMPPKRGQVPLYYIPRQLLHVDRSVSSAS